MNVNNSKYKFIVNEIFESLVVAFGYSVPVIIVLLLINLGVAYWPVYILIYMILFVLIFTLKLRENRTHKSQIFKHEE